MSINIKEVEERVKWFMSGMLSPMLLSEVERSFIHMANGGDGDVDHIGSVRHNYPGKSDLFFQRVCDAMGWVWLQE